MKVEVAASWAHVPDKPKGFCGRKATLQLLVFKPPVFVSNSTLGFSSVFRAQVLL